MKNRLESCFFLLKRKDEEGGGGFATRYPRLVKGIMGFYADFVSKNAVHKECIVKFLAFHYPGLSNLSNI